MGETDGVNKLSMYKVNPSRLRHSNDTIFSKKKKEENMKVVRFSFQEIFPCRKKSWYLGIYTYSTKM